MIAAVTLEVFVLTCMLCGMVGFVVGYVTRSTDD